MHKKPNNSQLNTHSTIGTESLLTVALMVSLTGGFLCGVVKFRFLKLILEVCISVIMQCYQRYVISQIIQELTAVLDAPYTYNYN